MDVEHLRLLYVFQIDLGAFALTIRVPNGFRLKKREKCGFGEFGKRDTNLDWQLLWFLHFRAK